MAERLAPAIVALGSARDLGTREASSTPWDAADPAFAARLAELLADHSDALLAAYVDDQATLSPRRLLRELAAQTGRALVHPVLFGSALTGAGVDALIAAVTELLPATRGHAVGPVSGTVFKVERGPAGERIAWVRLFSGTVRTRDRLEVRGDGGRKVTAISVFDRGAAAPGAQVTAGRIGKLWELGDVQLEIPADTLGPLLPLPARLRAVPGPPAMRGSSCTLEGEIPAARLHELQLQLPGPTRGEGMLEYAFDSYQPVRGAIPTRPRSDHNPLNRKEYLLHVVRRV